MIDRNSQRNTRDYSARQCTKTLSLALKRIKKEILKASHSEVRGEVLFQWFDVLLIRASQVRATWRIDTFSILNERHQGIANDWLY
jgi:hypothetical protein